MQDFKNNLRKRGRVFLFFLILALLLGGVSWKVGQTAADHEEWVHYRNKSALLLRKEPKDSIDVLILGDSLSYTAFSPMQMWNKHGIAAFVGGQSGQNIQESYYMLKTAFENQKPRLVFLETNVIFRPQRGNSGLTMTLAAMGSYYFPIFTHHDIWKSVLTDKQYPEENYKGFQFREVTDPYRGGAYMKETSQKEKISSTVEDYLEKIRMLCVKNQAELVLISTPSPANYNYKRHNTLEEYARQKGLKYEDLNLKEEELGIDWERDSLDKGDHLNLSGAWKVTDFIGTYLHENFDLPDRREDEAYASWNELGKKYEERAKEKLEAMKKDDKITGEEADNRRERSLPVYE